MPPAAAVKAVKCSKMLSHLISLCPLDLRVVLKVKLGVKVDSELSHRAGCWRDLEVFHFNRTSHLLSLSREVE